MRVYKSLSLGLRGKEPLLCSCSTCAAASSISQPPDRRLESTLATTLPLDEEGAGCRICGSGLSSLRDGPILACHVGELHSLCLHSRKGGRHGCAIVGKVATKDASVHLQGCHVCKVVLHHTEHFCFRLLIPGLLQLAGCRNLFSCDCGFIHECGSKAALEPLALAICHPTVDLVHVRLVRLHLIGTHGVHLQCHLCGLVLLRLLILHHLQLARNGASSSLAKGCFRKLPFGLIDLVAEGLNFTHPLALHLCELIQGLLSLAVMICLRLVHVLCNSITDVVCFCSLGFIRCLLRNKVLQLLGSFLNGCFQCRLLSLKMCRA
mmetsp:Transcript_39043/g.90204  ORF Transcript_39043/g.90204 Transcript_39043/m.90204 type:complete len:321 (+) Transcript_39043:50-1012(+)